MIVSEEEVGKTKKPHNSCGVGRDVENHKFKRMSPLDMPTILPLTLPFYRSIRDLPQARNTPLGGYFFTISQGIGDNEFTQVPHL